MAVVKIQPDIEQVLVVHIDGYWTANDFSILFDSFNRLHNFQNLLNNYSTSFENLKLEFGSNIDTSRLPQFINLREGLVRQTYITFNQLNLLEDFKRQSQLPTQLFRDEQLRVNKIKYSSKGSIDFIGIGKAIEAITTLITHYFPNEEKRVDIMLKKQEVELKEQEVLEKRIANLKRMGFSQSQTMSILGMESLHINNIITLKEKGQVLGIELKRGSNK